MYHNKILVILFLLLFSVIKISAQEEIDLYSVYYNNVEPIDLQLSKFPHGTVQWQFSRDKGNSWDNIGGANEFSIKYNSDTSVYLRAAVLSGTCDSVFSQYAYLKTLRVFTSGINELTDSSATIHCEIDTINTAIKEYGILYSNQQIVDENSLRFSLFPPVSESYSIEINGLEAGVQYYARAFALTKDSTIVLGNLLDFSPVKIALEQNYSVGTETAFLNYEILGISSEDIDEHGIFLNTVSGSIQSAEKIIGIYVNGQFSASAASLNQGMDYFVQAFMKIGESYYYSSEKQIRTWSEYNDPIDTSPFDIKYRIEWNDTSTAVKLNPEGTFGDYARVERIGNSDTLILVYQGGPNTNDWLNIYLRKSFDNGTTWEDQEIIMNLADYPGEYWRFCTPELLFLQNGWLLLAFEANARPDENKSSVQILISKDSASTWNDPIKYVTGRTWEPSMVQLPHGEIELFYSSEDKWWGTDNLYQDIQLIRSTDNGESWSDPQVVAYYPNKRDGMPVPLLLQGNKGVVFAIECVGSSYSPYIIHRDMNEPWILEQSDFINSPNRWLIEGFSGHGGAPYILQLPSGEIVYSAHIYRGGDWHQNNYQEVMIGDNDSRNFENLTRPWGLPPLNEGAINNSLFLKDETTIVTISTRMFTNGTGGLYWLEGKIVLK